MLSPLLLVISISIIIFSGFPIFFVQERIGINAKSFKIFKFRTMIISKEDLGNTITTLNDIRITKIGRFLRKWKLDELPTLLNILIGDMSFVGPRPDVSGYADCLQGENRRLLDYLPGITSPATIKYANEEKLFIDVIDVKKYNDEVIFPDKVKINIQYFEKWNLMKDIKIILKTVFRKNY